MKNTLFAGAAIALLMLNAPYARADDCHDKLVALAGEGDLMAVQTHSYNKVMTALDPTLTGKPMSDIDKDMAVMTATFERDKATAFATHLRAYQPCTTERWLGLLIDQIDAKVAAAQASLDFVVKQ